MFVASLIARPGALDPSLVENIRNAWGGAAAQWLSPDEAAEFYLPEVPGNRWDVWDELQAQSVDLVMQPEAGRKKRVLLADMDSTMIRQECIDELTREAGFGPQGAEITRRAINGELEFQAAMVERVAFLEGLDFGVIDKVLAERITETSGGRTLIATMKAAGAYCALVSSGFDAFTVPVSRALGFDEQRSNHLLVVNGKLTGKVSYPILDSDSKVVALEEITDQLGLGDADVMAVGDGANDLGMLGRASAGVALHANPTVAAQCDMRINFGDLTALLFLQGYSKDEFI